MNDQPGKRLLRSRDDRVLAGVAGGVARYLDLDPTLVRVGFVAAALFGGLGIAAYLILAVVTPNDDGTGAPAKDDRPSAWLVILAVLAVLILLPGPFWGPFEWGWGWWWGGTLWLLLLLGGGVWLFMTLRDRGRRDARGGSEAPGSPPPGGAGESSEARRLEAAETRPMETAETRRMGPPGGEAPAPRDRSRRVLRAVAVAALVLAAVCAAFCVAALSAWATATGNGVIVAGGVIAIGAALVVAAFTGEARWRWLIVPALVLALPAGAVAAADVSFDGGVGERQYRPTAAAQVPSDGYSLGVGQLIVDLRGLPWRRGQVLEVETEGGLGQTVVSVPSRVCVQADAAASAGDAFVRGQRSSGLDAEVIESPPQGNAPRLVLSSELEVGQIVVSDLPPEELSENQHGFGDRRFDDLDEGSEEERLAAQRACEG